MSKEHKELHDLANQIAIAQGRARILVRALQREATEPSQQKDLCTRAEQILLSLNQSVILLQQHRAQLRHDDALHT